MDSKGQHFIVDAFECRSDTLNNAEQLKELLTKAINQLGMEILSTHFHSFTPQGVTGVIVFQLHIFRFIHGRSVDMRLWICTHVGITIYGWH